MIQFLKKHWSLLALSLLGILFVIAVGTLWYQALIWPAILTCRV